MIMLGLIGKQSSYCFVSFFKNGDCKDFYKRKNDKKLMQVKHLKGVSLCATVVPIWPECTLKFKIGRRKLAIFTVRVNLIKTRPELHFD